MRESTRPLILRLIVVCLLLIGALAPGSAFAQGFDLQQFNPMPNQDANFLSTASARVPEDLGWSAGIFFNYANNPLIRRDENDEPIERLVGRQATTHLLGSVTLWERLELGLDLPLMMLQQGTSLPGSGISPDQASFGVGDLRLVPKVQVFTNRETPVDDGVALAVLVDAHLPTGSGEHLQGGDLRVGPRLAFDAVVGGPRIGANIGYQYRDESIIENLQVRDTLSWNLGVEIPVVDDLRLTGEAFGRVTPGAEEIRRTESPTEFLVGGKYQWGNVLMVAGAGSGILRGYGTPDFRAFTGVSWVTEPPKLVAQPAPEPECRVASLEDDCTDIPANICTDGVLRTYQAACEEGRCSYRSREQRCPEGTECGQDDGQVACVVPPECTADDDCIDQPAPSCTDAILTTYAGRCVDGSCAYDPVETQCDDDQECGLDAGQPGCVDKPDLVEVDDEANQIQIRDVVLFEVDSATIDSRSFGLLNQVASVMYNNPHLTKIRVEGHTDTSGTREYNLELSQRRAESVRAYLIERGVEGERLSAEGFGPDQPRETNDTKKGRAANRRVEFHIEERSQ